MKDLRLRPQQIKDARRFYEILIHPDFVHFAVNVESVAAEKRFLRESRRKRALGVEYNDAILLGEEIVGAIGLRVDQARAYVGEIGYFVDRAYWGRGIAPAAVRRMERFGFAELGLRRIELLTLVENLASMRVAEKCGYRREGVQRDKLMMAGRYRDAVMFAKTIEDHVEQGE